MPPGFVVAADVQAAWGNREGLPEALEGLRIALLTNNMGILWVAMEAATWNGTNILLTSKKLSLRTEASNRFEKQLHPRLALQAQRAAGILGCDPALRARFGATFELDRRASAVRGDPPGQVYLALNLHPPRGEPNPDPYDDV